MADLTNAKRPRGIYLLPNLLTTATVFFGYYAIVVASVGEFAHAAMAIYVAVITDGLDGRIARMTNTQSDFGSQFDSLADMVAFGAAPAIVMLGWALGDFGKVGWTVSFLYVAATALRLARFNAQEPEERGGAFSGLPCTLAAAVMAGFIWVCNDLQISAEWIKCSALATTVLMSVLQVSNIPYMSLKKLDMGRRVSFLVAFAVVLLFFLISLNPPLVLFAGVYCYALSGPVIWLYGLLRADRAEGGIWERLLRLGHDRDDA